MSRKISSSYILLIISIFVVIEVCEIKSMCISDFNPHLNSVKCLTKDCTKFYRKNIQQKYSGIPSNLLLKYDSSVTFEFNNFELRKNNVALDPESLIDFRRILAKK